MANWVHETARSGVVNQVTDLLKVITDANDSIAALASVPTARLERLLAEHVDLCSYRADAWVTAFYSQRHRPMTEVLPWDHINVKKGREYLEKEQTRSLLQLQVMAEAT